MGSPLEAISVLEQQKAAKERTIQDDMELGAFMMNVLQTRGELIIARRGLYGGIPGIIGSAVSGQRIIQSTLPVPLGNGDYLALRHPFRQPDKHGPRADGVELIKTQQEGPGYCVIEPKIDTRYANDPVMAEHKRKDGLKYTWQDEVLASFITTSTLRRKSSALRISDDLDHSLEQRAAVESLVKHIEDSLEPISDDWQRVTQRLPYTPTIDLGGARHIREGATLIQNLNISDVDRAVAS